MTQSERRSFLIKMLVNEIPEYHSLRIPNDTNGQKKLLRSLMNVRPPRPIGEDFLAVHGEILDI